VAIKPVQGKSVASEETYRSVPGIEADLAKISVESKRMNFDTESGLVSWQCT
jgi:hypothetical protein